MIITIFAEIDTVLKLYKSCIRLKSKFTNSSKHNVINFLYFGNLNISYMNSDFRKDLVEYVLSRTDGSNELDEIVKTRPSKKFFLGPLAARKCSNNNKSAEDDKYGDKSSIKATRLRVSFLVNNKVLEKEHKLSVLISGYVFFKIFSDEINEEAEIGVDLKELNKDSSSQKFVWKRMPFMIPADIITQHGTFEYSKKISFEDIINKCNSDKNNYYKIPQDTWKAEVHIVVKDYGSDSNIVHFYFSNDSIEDDKNDYNVEKTLFDCKLHVDLGDMCISQFMEEYLYNGSRQRYFYDFRTINCQAKFTKDDDNSSFETDNYYLFEQKEIETVSSSDSYDLSFKSLSQKNGLNALESILETMEKLKSKYDSMILLSSGDFLPRNGNRQVEYNELKSTIDNFQVLISSFRSGLESLKFNHNAMIAFESMNRVFEQYYNNKLGPNISLKSHPSWRVFQIAFIVSLIRSIVNEKDLDFVDVLHVATGGGKSEAYFGLIVFSIFYERLMGKADGVTAIVKFPLRMLSIQQLERLASIIIFADMLREEKKDIFKGSEFSLGYYVGNSEDFPDLYSKVRAELYEDSKFTKPNTEPVYSKIITNCPLCIYGKRGKIRIIDEPLKKRLLHQCDIDSSHTFHIYYSDREVFRYRPTVIVSTVDKWAGLAQQRRARALLGSNGSMCPDGHGFIPSGDKCEDKKEEGICENIGKNLLASPGPIISIQDEIHLLKESFGTISSHFEGLIEEIISKNTNGRKIKHVAMSATLNGVSSQIRELYRKKAFVISGETSVVDNPAFDLFFKRKSNTKRLIYGMIPNLRDNHYATLRTLLHTVEFVDMEQRNFMSNPQRWLNKYGMKEENDAIQTFKDFLTHLTYHLKKQDAEDMSRFSDAVINDALSKEAKITTRGIVLTGDKGLEELKNTIDIIRNKSTQYLLQNQILPNASYEPIFSTSVVSHGIDLEELNFMVFQGIPYTTSEYIQTLSRVGRKREGVVLVWLYPNRVRDGSFFKNFGRYHETLDHEVLPAPIKRNSRLGIKQTINSLFCAGIIQFLSNKHGKPLIYKQNIEELDSNDKKELIQFIKSAYGDHVNLNIEFEVEERIRQICDSHNKSKEFFPKVLSDTGYYYYRNQSGMRGIQGSLMLKPTGSTRSLLRQLEGEN